MAMAFLKNRNNEEHNDAKRFEVRVRYGYEHCFRTRYVDYSYVFVLVRGLSVNDYVTVFPPVQFLHISYAKNNHIFLHSGPIPVTKD